MTLFARNSLVHDDEEAAEEGEEDTDKVDDGERVASNVLVVATVEHVRLANRVLQQHDTEIAYSTTTPHEYTDGLRLY